MRKVFLSMVALATAMCATAGTNWKMGNTDFKVDTIFHSTTGPGVTTTALKLQWQSDGVYSTNAFVTTVDLTNPDIEIRGVQGYDAHRAETPAHMASRKNGEGNGTYLAGINGDFFNMGGSTIVTNGASIVDGKVYNPSSYDPFWNKWDAYTVVDNKKDVRIVQDLTASFNLQFPNKASHSFNVDNANAGNAAQGGGRYTNYLCIYTYKLIDKGITTTGTNVWGTECAMKLVSGSLDNNDAVFEITTAPTAMGTGGNMTIPADGYILSGNGTAYDPVLALKVGDRVSVAPTVTIEGKQYTPQQAVGGCSMLVIEGKEAGDEYFSKTVIDHFQSSQPRTAIGYNKDRSKLYLVVVDKYTTNNSDDAEKQAFGSSNGFFMYRMAQLMINLGSYTAMNFDGGQSSQLYNHIFGVRNVPRGDDKTFRAVANGVFAVSTSPADGEIAYIEVYQKNVKLAEGETFTPRVLGFNQYGVLVNKDVKDFTFTVAPSLGAVSGSTFTANATKGSTKAVVTCGAAKAGVIITVNGGGEAVTSGDDSAPVMVDPTYTPDEPIGIDRVPAQLVERWKFLNTEYGDGWDSSVPDWTSADQIKKQHTTRFATAFNGKFYTLDMMTMSIAEIGPDGKLTPLYKLPSLEDRTINGTPDYYGTSISHDDVGNFLIGHLFTKPESCQIWTIYNPKTGEYKHLDVKPEDLESWRIDCVGRVLGDLFNNAYFMVAQKAINDEAIQKMSLVHVVKNTTTNEIEATAEATPTAWSAKPGTTVGVCQPIYESISELGDGNPLNAFSWYYKKEGTGEGYSVLYRFINGQPSENYAKPLCLTNISGTNGYDTFVLNGKRYYVLGYATVAENQNAMDIVVIDEQGTIIAKWENPDYVSNLGYSSIEAVPVNRNNVNIYVYNFTGSLNGQKPGGTAGALLRLTLDEDGAPVEEPADITPKGLDFESYEITDEAAGAKFKLFSTESSGSYSSPQYFYKNTHPTAFDDHGQLSYILFRGMGNDLNNQAKVDEAIQPMFAVRNVPEVGKALVICEQWSPYASTYGWTGKGFVGAAPQLGTYMDPKLIKDKTDVRHYVRVRIVYNVMLRGCHYNQMVAANNDLKVVKSIYATHDGNWVIPANDHDLGASYAETGINFAKWVNETFNVDDIPENPELVDGATTVEPFDLGHGEIEATRAYIMNPNRFRVYEFDTYIEPGATTSVQFNFLDRNISYSIKEIKFTDLGTDEADATLLGRRKLGWQYFTKTSTGIEDIVTDDAVNADAPAVYYNLQGVRVTNPSNGIYIVRRGNKVTKEYVAE